MSHRFLEHDGERLAVEVVPGVGPGLFFLTGFGSDMTGSKAEFLNCLAREKSFPFTRFDYSGHGQSSGRFRDGTIRRWVCDALAVFDATAGEQVLIGSSMGGWIALHVALARPDRVRAVIGIAAAPDFTEDLIWDLMDETARDRLQSSGFLEVPSDYGSPTLITNALVEDGRTMLLLREALAISCPVRLLHGMRDGDVPWQTSLRLAEALDSSDVRLHLIKDGEHRLSRDSDLAALRNIVLDLLDDLPSAPQQIS